MMNYNALVIITMPCYSNNLNYALGHYSNQFWGGGATTFVKF